MRTQSAAHVTGHAAQSRSDTELLGSEAKNRRRRCTQAQRSGLRCTGFFISPPAFVCVLKVYCLPVMHIAPLADDSRPASGHESAPLLSNDPAEPDVKTPPPEQREVHDGSFPLYVYGLLYLVVVLISILCPKDKSNAVHASVPVVAANVELAITFVRPFLLAHVICVMGPWLSFCRLYSSSSTLVSKFGALTLSAGRTLHSPTSFLSPHWQCLAVSCTLSECLLPLASGGDGCGSPYSLRCCSRGNFGFPLARSFLFQSGRLESSQLPAR